MSGKNSDQAKTSNEDNRAVWERPAFRRLAASYAEASPGVTDDGNCVGGGQQKSCKIN
jgi:hypothetical protein